MRQQPDGGRAGHRTASMPPLQAALLGSFATGWPHFQNYKFGDSAVIYPLLRL